jgi:hypothetical protein
LAAAGGPIPEGIGDVPGSLAATVLLNTIGSACGQAREHLPDHVDQALDSVVRELVEVHLAGCSDCRRLSGTLVALRRELPKLAEISLDGQFTNDVLKATVTRQSRWKSWWQGDWSAWVQRPRFAMEAAYVGLLVVMLVLGAFSTPVAALPQKGVQLMQPEPDAPSVWTNTQESLGTFWEWVASMFEKVESNQESTKESP